MSRGCVDAQTRDGAWRGSGKGDVAMTQPPSVLTTTGVCPICRELCTFQAVTVLRGDTASPLALTHNGRTHDCSLLICAGCGSELLLIDDVAVFPYRDFPPAAHDPLPANLRYLADAAYQYVLSSPPLSAAGMRRVLESLCQHAGMVPQPTDVVGDQQSEDYARFLIKRVPLNMTKGLVESHCMREGRAFTGIDWNDEEPAVHALSHIIEAAAKALVPGLGAN